ncbi:TetR/AcrR family transcriptional regulator [Streptomyces sp. NPDC091289]|uniref:TetR/AcrR family transcriptional regulator n=1 Tax=Streptomyces sp. NPDC091289 TaxID=3365989 RepID=UPI0037F2AE2A
MRRQHDGKLAMAVERSLELLWGDRSRPTRGPKPGLSVDKIVASAIEIADTEGLDALSMQRVAARLNFSTMSLYRYVPGKEQLFDVMMDVAGGPAPDLDDLDGWRPKIERWVHALWARYQQHPWMLQVRVSGPPVGPNALSWLEAALRALSETRLRHEEVLSVSLFLNGAVSGLARLSTDTARATEATGRADAPAGDPAPGYSETLASLIDAERFPTLLKMVSAGVLRPGSAAGSAIGAGSAPDVEFGLQRLLDGIEVYVEAHDPTRTRPHE